MGKMHEADLRPLDLAATAQQVYDPTHFQPVLFCAESFEEMYGMLREHLMNW
jgi:phenylalanine-4-hydroxylase